MKLTVKSDVPVSLGRDQAVQRGACAAQQRVCGGEGRAAKGRSREPLARRSGCSAGPAEAWGQVPVLICRAEYVIRGPVNSAVGGGSSRLARFTETEHKLSGLCFILLQTQSFFEDMKMYFDSTGKPFPTQLPP